MTVILVSLLLTLVYQSIECKYNVNKIINKYQQLHVEETPLDNEALAFSYKNCGPATDPLVLKTLTVTPDPIHFPGIVTVSADVVLNVNLSSPITLSLKVFKIVGPSKIQIPCISNVGSCTYNDVCTMLPQNPSECPSYFIKNQLPCSCPFQSGEYSVQDYDTQVNLNLPLLSGPYQVTADISANNKHIGCLFLQFNYK